MTNNILKKISFSLVSLLSIGLSACANKNKDIINNVDLSKYQQDSFLTVTETIEIEPKETYDLIEFVSSSLDITKLTFIPYNERYVSIQGSVLTGKEKGNTDVYAIYNEQYYQIFKVEVKSSLSKDFSMDYGRLHNKTAFFFGDSVTYGSGINESERLNSRYSKLLMDYYGLKGLDTTNNFAIPGTTMTYEYEGSHIYEEYHNNTNVFRKNGTSLILNNYNVFKNVDYVFIAYTHNDQYFQVPIGTNEFMPESIEECNTFKACYSYAINVIKKANPQTRIIIIAPNYSEYQPSSVYDINLRYPDYIKALEEIADYHQVKFINLWPETERIHKNVEKLLADSGAHLNARGHQVVADIIKNS